MKLLKVFHQASLRRILEMKYFIHVPNEEVLRRAGIRSIGTLIISTARIRWCGQNARPKTVKVPNELEA